MKKVSICIPTYNNPDDLEKLMVTIIEQSFQDFEVIITDDSTNNKIENLIKKYDNIDLKYVHNEKPLGHVVNWNAAMSLATGDYLKIMFSDDWFTTSYSLQEFVTMLDNNPQASMAFSGSMQVSKAKCYARCISDLTAKRMKEDVSYSFVDYQIGAPSATIYRGCNARFDVNTGFASDMDLHLSILTKKKAFVYTKNPIISIGIHEEQYTDSFLEWDNRKYIDYEYIFRKYHLIDNHYCKEHFCNCIIRYGKGRKTALDMNYTACEYTRCLVKWHWKNTILDFFCAIPYKIKKISGNFHK